MADAAITLGVQIEDVHFKPSFAKNFILSFEDDSSLRTSSAATTCLLRRPLLLIISLQG